MGFVIKIISSRDYFKEPYHKLMGQDLTVTTVDLNPIEENLSLIIKTPISVIKFPKESICSTVLNHDGQLLIVIWETYWKNTISSIAKSIENFKNKIEKTTEV